MTEQTGGFDVLEEAALAMEGAQDEAAVLALYRQQLETSLRHHLGDDRALGLADRFVNIIARRRREIELARGSNPTGVQ